MNIKTLALVLAVVLGGCGDPDGEENLAACQDFLAAVSCGDIGAPTLYGPDFCQPYEESSCDMTAYWDCLANNIVCDETVEPVLFEIDPDGICGQDADCLP
jgi:hypothetical protein